MRRQEQGSRVRKTVAVSHGGQITVPIERGGVVCMEDHSGEIINPMVAMNVEMYPDTQIAEWDEQDRLDDADRVRYMAG